ncbi:MAG: helix-turn-helix transcriptional regulator [Rhodocyclaceae bacterium]|nr:helix-turn-helix transcriptional regulator [Rhodocyclaceae bacterium]
MKYPETPLIPASRQVEATVLGTRLARLRLAKNMRQADAAARAGISRSTAALIEKGDPGRTLGQVLRYLDAIAPDQTLLTLLQETDPALVILAQAEARQRVRRPSTAQLDDLDF